MFFGAINPRLETNIISSEEMDIRGKDFISWGKNNDYPIYLLSLYNEVPTLKSIIDGTRDYVIGEGIRCNVPGFSETVNRDGETLEEVASSCMLDYLIYGGFAINVVRNNAGGIAGIYYLNYNNIRSNKNGTEFFYSEDWSKSFGRVKYIQYPAFDPEGSAASSIFYYKNERNKTYPIPVYGAAIKSCEIEKSIVEYHLNSINNGFMGSYIVNFNNGVPTDEDKQDIEDDFNEKFCGYENAQRSLLSFNDSKEQEVTVTKIDSDDFGAKYEALSKKSRQEIFTSFRATPNLFGIMTETTGFSQQEFEEAFKLYNKTQILPIQKVLTRTMNKIFNSDNSIEITPFKYQ